MQIDHEEDDDDQDQTCQHAKQSDSDNFLLYEHHYEDKYSGEWDYEWQTCHIENFDDEVFKYKIHYTDLNSK